MTVILKSMTFGTPGGEGQNRIQPVQCLDGALFIHTENRSIGGGIHVQPDDSGCLFFKFRVIRGHVTARAVRTKTRLSPNSGHSHVVDLENGCQFARRPMGRTIARAFAGVVQNPGFNSGSVTGWFFALVTSKKSREPIFYKPLFPTNDVILAAFELVHDLREGAALAQFQN